MSATWSAEARTAAAERMREQRAGSYQPRLPREEFPAVVARHAAGEPATQIASHYGVHVSRIYRIIRACRDPDLAEVALAQEPAARHQRGGA
jgi:DNA invertase Pin-like site-specific DNA recombinase